MIDTCTLYVSDKFPKNCRQLQHIADEFWFIDHLELNVEVDLACDGSGSHFRTTTNNAHKIWNYIWHEIRESRLEKKHDSIRPRLRSLDLVAGSYPQRTLWETCARQKFMVELSERDDEARRGIATVKCLEVEAVKMTLGHGGHLRNSHQEALMREVTTRAAEGLHPGFAPAVLKDRGLLRLPAFWDLQDQRRFEYR